MIPTPSADSNPAPAAPSSPREALVDNLPLVRRVVRSVARRYRLSPDDEAELFSDTLFRLLEDNGAVMKAFRAESSLSTYLAVVVTRIWLDRRVRVWGKWRPSRRACRMGKAGVHLERLLVRERLTPGEAIRALVEHPRFNVASREARALYDALDVRVRPMEVAMPSGPTAPGPVDCSPGPLDLDDLTSQARRVTEVLRGAIAALDERDRRLLGLRFRRSASVADIARASGANQKALYRDFERIYDRLKSSLAAGGVRISDVRHLLGHAVAQIRTAIPQESGASL
jgi:RNA polymerase sigma factor (sigma-70 family)